MDPKRRNDRPPTWLYALVVVVGGGGLAVAYSWLARKWGTLAGLWVEAAILVAVVVVGVFLSLRGSRR